MIIFDNDAPFGKCNKCGYEFDSNLLNEYIFSFCPKCGKPLCKLRWDHGSNMEKEAWCPTCQHNKDCPVFQQDQLERGSSNGSRCDRCGAPMIGWQKSGEKSDNCKGGNCVSCGDDLCTDCAGEWDEDGVCEKCRYEQIKSVMNEYEAKHPEWVTKKIPECGTCRANPICNMGVKPGDELCIYKRSIGSDTEQGRKDDAGKLRFDLVPWRPFEEVVKVLGYGAERYGDNNWKEVKPFTDRYSAALMRHYSKWAQGERLDPESGLPHLAHMICDGLFLLYRETWQHESYNVSRTN